MKDMFRSLARRGSLAFDSFGSPSAVLKLVKSSEPLKPKMGEVTVAIKASLVQSEDIRAVSKASSVHMLYIYLYIYIKRMHKHVPHMHACTHTYTRQTQHTHKPHATHVKPL